MGQPLIFIIVLNWNGKEDTLDCLKSVFELQYLNFKVLVVDNGSTDGSVDAIRGRFPDATILETHRNLGFAGGNNVGIRHAIKNNADFVLLLNNDTVVGPELLTALTKAARSVPQGGMFSPKIYYHSQPDQLWYAGASWDPQLLDFRIRGAQEIDDGVTFNEMVDTDIAIGCALFIRAEVLDKVGLMYEEFFLMHEESDWCYRAKRAGYKIIYVPDGKVWHKVSRSFGGSKSPLMSYFATRNRLLWAERNLPRGLWLRLCVRVFGELFLPGAIGRSRKKALVRRIYSALLDCPSEIRRRSRDPAFKAQICGARDYLLRRFGDCPDAVKALQRSALQ